MSLRASQFVAHQANNIGFPTTGGTTKKGGTKKSTAKRVSAEEKAEQARLDDPYGGKPGQTGKAGGRTRVVRRRVRRRRVANGTTTPNYGTSKAQQQAKTTKQAKAQQQLAQQGPDSSQHMMRKMNSQSSLNRMTANFRSGQSGQPAGPQTQVGKKMAMLSNLKNYMSNDYNAMKANDSDKAFTYRTSEARQLVATLGTMVASSTKQTKQDTKAEDKKPLSPKQFAAQKGLLKRIKMMSDPSAQMPEGLPPDYQPFESVA